MNAELSPNAQAILLLTAPLLAGGRRRATGPKTGGKRTPLPSPKPLSTAEYRDFARQLQAVQREPADLLGSGATETLCTSGTNLDGERIRHLLGRGFLLAQAIERWRSRALWIVTRADPDYPKRLKARLRENAPPVLYGCGDPTILNGGGLAVVGSRKVNEGLIKYAEDVGRLAARAKVAIVSGGARGTDEVAMRGALEVGGRSVGVLANGLERAALNRSYRNFLVDGRLALVCPYDPASRFVVGHAMQRNKLIYALCDAALVVNSDRGRGGTWAGATEQLDKLRFVPVYARADGERSDGLEALLGRGAEAWTNPKTPDGLRRFLRADPLPAQTPVPLSPSASGQYDLPLAETWEVREDRVVELVACADAHVSESAARTSAAKCPEKLLLAISAEMSRQELLAVLKLRDVGNLRERYLKPCLKEGWIEMTIPDKPSSRNQRFRLTPAGRNHLEGMRADAAERGFRGG
ncbi:DNA-processing protein DprA [Candidatus Palauibacter sp.]|uniref:DNA-processing protein DprA n=1 Tax=Candidatus Palauibacter sp. TaxID=3101350 RepID=UPI003B010814